MPLFAFGFGLSYTDFVYGNLRLAASGSGGDLKVKVGFEVKNVGKTAGDEVVQLYLCDVVCSVVRPAKELKRFGRIHLKPGETASMEYELGFRDLSFMDRAYEWVVEAGEFRVMVGPSSDNIALSGVFSI